VRIVTWNVSSLKLSGSKRSDHAPLVADLT
jgi:exonuclease III